MGCADEAICTGRLAGAGCTAASVGADFAAGGGGADCGDAVTGAGLLIGPDWTDASARSGVAAG
jgi:hypothetical protein